MYNQFSSYFNKKLNIQKGSVVGIIGINSLEWVNNDHI